jgi:hypothetical protein
MDATQRFSTHETLQAFYAESELPQRKGSFCAEASFRVSRSGTHEERGQGSMADECKRYVIVDGMTWEDVAAGDNLEQLEGQADQMNEAHPEKRYFVRDRDERKRVYGPPKTETF